MAGNGFRCIGCLLEQRDVLEPAVAIHRCRSLCIEHLIAAWRDDTPTDELVAVWAP